MRRALLITLAVLSTAHSAAAAPQDAFGIWRTADGDAAVEILPCGDSICGKLVWYREKRSGPDAGFDSRNPSPENRTRRLCGLTMLGGFTRVAGGWEGGWIYDPESGNSYRAAIEPDGPDRMKLRGYIGIPLLGRTEVWTRAPADQQRCG